MAIREAIDRPKTKTVDGQGGEAEINERLQLREQRSLWRDAWKRLLRNKLAIVGLIVVIFLLLLATFAPLLAPYSYDKENFSASYQSPSAEYPFGTDAIGRDQFSRIIYGARISMIVGLGSQIIVLLIGVPLGAIAGYYGGKVDLLLMRFVDVMYAFPTLLFVILIMTMLGPGLLNIFIALGLTSWVTLCRLTRGQFLSLRSREFVVAAEAVGTKPAGIIFRHLLPNALGPIIVALTFGIPNAIFTEAALSFIGVGISPPTPTWGGMVGEYQSSLRSYWYLATFPSIAIALTMLAFSFLGDGMRDALDPKMKR